ncbi:MAG: DUF1345 domain-containing protein [Arachidicoccus sp.]|nr:DUF1345 domain-containing protein [Arachidicoccus sp.]
MANKKNYWFNQLSASFKVIISAVIALGVYIINPLKPALQLIFSWDVFSFLLLFFVWITFFTTNIKDIRNEAQREDSSRIVIFVIVIMATILSMFAVLHLVINDKQNSESKILSLALGFICMIFSWCLVQTFFTLRYAHLYYAKDEKKNSDEEKGGLEFPGKNKPDFIDFAYFAFTIGMTFQVSDVEISEKKIRRITLLHSMIAFAFNALVISLSVNIISGLASK